MQSVSRREFLSGLALVVAVPSTVVAQERTYVDDLKEVFAIVKGGFRPVSDEEQWDLPDFLDDWRAPDNPRKVVGDCDDFAIACRQLLRERGIPSRLMACITETREAHVVCTSGNFVLDNRLKYVVTLSHLPRYTFLAVSGFKKGEEWRAVEGVRR